MSLKSVNKLTILGFGRMGKAMVSGWLDNDLQSDSINIIDPNINNEDVLVKKNGLQILEIDDADLSDGIIILSIKPQAANNVLEILKNKVTSNTLIISIIAGYSISDIREYIGFEPKVIRVMPNTPAAVGMGMSVLFTNDKLTMQLESVIEELFNSIGRVYWIKEEPLMHIVTAISGSGPAYYYYFTECLSKIATDNGLDEQFADILVKQTLLGSSSLMDYSNQNTLSKLRKDVTSPGGTTEAALKVLMDDDKLYTLLSDAISDAIKKSKSLSQ